MDKRNISLQGVKRRRANLSSNQNQRLVREKVNIPDDTWLQALKFLTCPQWMQKRFVCSQINGIVQRNIFRLPKMTIDSADMYYIDVTWDELNEPQAYERATVVFDTIMSEQESTEWFKSRGFTRHAPEGIPDEDTLIDARKWIRHWDGNMNICVLGSAREKIQLSWEQKFFPWFRNPRFWMEFRKPVLFWAQFNPLLNQCSWNYLAQFLKAIFHPTSYMKSVKIFAVNQKFIDSLKCNIGSVDNETHYIRCESFSLRGIGRVISETNIVHLPDALKWLAKNVRAESIHIPWLLCNKTSVPVADFLFDPSGAKQCASEKMEICTNKSEPAAFINILIEKFHTIPLVESAIPTIKFDYYRPEGLPARLGQNLIEQEVDSEGADALYVISNGHNQMRISFRFADRDTYKCMVRIYSI